MDLGPALMACSDEPITALAYVSVSANVDQPNEVRVARGQLEPAVAACVHAALVKTPFSASPLGGYSFLARFDSRHDRLKLAVEQASAELAAAPRKSPPPLEDPITERLFEARVALSKETDAVLLERQKLVKEAKDHVAALKRELETHRRAARAPQPRSSSAEDAARDRAAAEARRRSDEEKIAKEAAKNAAAKNQKELEYYRRINREYREREERAKMRRAWESWFDL